MKKNIYYTVIVSALFSFITIESNAQVGIETDSPDVNSILDLSKAPKGLVIPWVTTLPTSPKRGTIIFDATKSNTPNFKYYNGAWVTLSGDGAVNLTIQNSYNEISGGVAISPANALVANLTPNGALDLQSNSKALMLPVISSPQTNLVNPSSGTIVYDSTDKTLMMFTGQVWEYYK